MTDWKMPEWMRKILSIYFMTKTISKIDADEDYPIMSYQLTSFLVDLRSHELIHTPTERDEREKRIEELEAENSKLKKKLQTIENNVSSWREK